MHRSLRGRVLGAVESGATGGSATWTAPRKRAPGAGAVAGGWVGDDTVTERGVPSTGRAELQGRREYSLPFPSLLFAGFVSSPRAGQGLPNFGSPFGGRCDFISGWPAQGPRDSWKKRMAEKWVWIKSGGGGYGWIGLCSLWMDRICRVGGRGISVTTTQLLLLPTGTESERERCWCAGLLLVADHTIRRVGVLRHRPNASFTLFASLYLVAGADLLWYKSTAG